MKTFPEVESCPTYWVKIFIAGPKDLAESLCREFCYDVGLCVTVEETKFIYTGGEEVGVIVGLINYPKFPTSSEDILCKALELAKSLCERMYQTSYSVMTTEETYWVSYKD